MCLGPRTCVCIARHERIWAQDWVAVKELKLSYYIGETLFTIYIYTHYGNFV